MLWQDTSLVEGEPSVLKRANMYLHFGATTDDVPVAGALGLHHRDTERPRSPLAWWVHLTNTLWRSSIVVSSLQRECKNVLSQRD
jgi:hypothetical protein